MKKKLINVLMPAILTAALMLITFASHAQYKTKTIGNKPRSGSANSSLDVVKGRQAGVKMNAGHRPVQLLQLNFDAESLSKDSLKFKVNVYQFNDTIPGENLIKQDIIGSLPYGKNRVSVNLEPYNVKVSGHILVAIEWLETKNADNHFAIGLFNGGSYYFKSNKWKKIPVAGLDFNMLVRKG